jgi:hypothetical protein
MTVVLPTTIAAIVVFLVAIAPITSAISTVNAVVSTSNAVNTNAAKAIADIKAKIAKRKQHGKKPVLPIGS